MKVVIFCGGMGVRMGEATQSIPKPMIPVGPHPILWHIMKWYASWGHTDFILCLGYHAESIKQYFLSYSDALANDFVMTLVGRDIEVIARDMDDWRISFVDTGVHAPIGERLLSVAQHIGSESIFLATYGDALTDVPLDDMIALISSTKKTGLFMSVRPRLEYHVVRADEDGTVRSVERLADADVRINGGFFVFRREIFDAIKSGEDLVEEPFSRLISRRELLAYVYDGFWEPMDTIKDKQKLDALYEMGHPPWRRGPPVR